MSKDTVTITKAEFDRRVEAAAQKHIERNSPPGFLIRTGGNSRVDINTAKGKALSYVRGLHALGAASLKTGGRMDFDIASKIMNSWKEETRSEVDEALVKVLKSGSMQAQDFASAGIFVDIEDSREVIEYLRAKAVVRNIPGVEKSTFVNGGKKMKRSASDVSASWVGEGEAAAVSDKPTYGEHIMTPKKMGARLPVSNDLLRRSSYNISEEILRKFTGKMSQVEDIAFLRGVGTQNSPKGLLNWCNSSNKFNANGTVNTANINADVAKIMTALDITDIEESQRSWIMNPRVSSYLSTLRDSNGNKFFPELSNNPATLGRNYQVFDSNNVPKNLGGGTESELYLVEGGNIVIADEYELQTIVDQNAYKDANGTLVSPADLDETVFRMFHSTDLFVRYDTGIAVLQQVTWGA